MKAEGKAKFSIVLIVIQESPRGDHNRIVYVIQSSALFLNLYAAKFCSLPSLTYIFLYKYYIISL